MSIAPWQLGLAVPDGQRYSCRRCGWCCRAWRIAVTPEERDRILAHDWSRVDTRFADQKLFDERALPDQPEPQVQTAQIAGRCVFLNDDMNCAIHRVLGPDAKPAGCRRFPVRFALTPDRILASIDYSCTSAVLNEGEPFTLETVHESLGRRQVDEVIAAYTRMLARGAHPGVMLTSRLPMAWGAYVELEAAMLRILMGKDVPLTARMGRVALLTNELARSAGESGWVGAAHTREFLRSAEENALSDGAALALSADAELAPLIGDVESPHSRTTGRGSTAIGHAMAIAERAGTIYLSTLGATVQLETMERITCDVDSTGFDDYLTRFAGNYILRQSPVDGADVVSGIDHLWTCISLAAWYARAAASIAERAEPSTEDLVTGIQVVEKAYVA